MPMPIRDMFGKPVLVCVNPHKAEEVLASVRRFPAGASLTTMLVWPGSFTLSMTYMAADGTMRPDLVNGVAVQLYMCSICGYVEMYVPQSGAIAQALHPGDPSLG